MSNGVDLVVLVLVFVVPGMVLVVTDVMASHYGYKDSKTAPGTTKTSNRTTRTTPVLVISPPGTITIDRLRVLKNPEL